MSKVVTFGSLNMDLTIQCQRLPQAGETVDGSDLIFNPGGKGGNQAVAAAKAGAVSEMIACVGQDAFGKEMINALENYGVNCREIRISTDAPTGMAFITRHNNDNRIILSAGANYALGETDVIEALHRTAQPGDLFVTQFECRRETTFAAIREARAMGLYTVFNPAPAKVIPPELFPCIDLLVLNQSETQFLTGIFPAGAGTCHQALDLFQKWGIRDVIITLGADGSIGRSNGQEFTVGACPVEVVDTTAAGDTYIGALAASLCKGRTMEESVVFATKAAALTIQKCGAQQSIPYESEIVEFFKEGTLC